MKSPATPTSWPSRPIPQTFSSRKDGILTLHGDPRKRHALLYRGSMDTMINLDAPEHPQLRREYMPYFTPPCLRGVTEAVRPEAGRLLNEIPPNNFVHAISKLEVAFTPSGQA